MRIGHGYDVHRFSDAGDEPLWLAGVEIPEPYSLIAHSDGDVLLHAVCDAILGAIGAGDIGEHFPDSDPAFSGASGATLVAEVLALSREKGWRPLNVDVTVICQIPRLAPYRGDMRSRLAALLALPLEAANIKATTTERLGFEGRGEGIACHAVVLMSPL